MREGGTPPPSPPAPVCPISPPPPLHQQWQNTDAVALAALAHRTTLPPTTRQQQWKRDIAALMSSSTARSGRQCRFGPSLKPIEKLPYEMTVEENAKFTESQVKDFFETRRAMKHPPPEEKIDLVKAKRTINALKRPPPPSPDNNHVRCLKKTLQEARQSGSTSTDKRLKERRSGKKFPSPENRRSNHAPRSRCLPISSQINR